MEQVAEQAGVESAEAAETQVTGQTDQPAEETVGAVDPLLMTETAPQPETAAQSEPNPAEPELEADESERPAIEPEPIPDEAKGIFLTFYNELVERGQIPPCGELPTCLK